MDSSFPAKTDGSRSFIVLSCTSIGWPFESLKHTASRVLSSALNVPEYPKSRKRQTRLFLSGSFLFFCWHICQITGVSTGRPQNTFSTSRGDESGGMNPPEIKPAQSFPAWVCPIKLKPKTGSLSFVSSAAYCLNYSICAKVSPKKEYVSQTVPPLNWFIRASFLIIWVATKSDKKNFKE